MDDNEISWEEHKQKYLDAKILTDVMRKNIPLLNYIDWSILDIDEGYCKTKVSLNHETSNQHKTLQAANFLLAADYTGGIAFGNIFRNFPTFGIHDITDGKGLSIWLLKAEISYKSPAVDDLYISSAMNKEDLPKNKERLYRKRPAIGKMNIDFVSRNKMVSSGTMTYYAQVVDYSEWKNKLNAIENG
jgi:hypothetical protein